MKPLLEHILPAQALGIELLSWNGRQAVLTAPLDRNLNDKGTAFAGSIDALLDLAGWSAIMLVLQDAGLEADVMIVESETRYPAAVRADMSAQAEIPAAEQAALLETLHTTGRCRVRINAELRSAERVCAVLSASYAVISSD